MIDTSQPKRLVIDVRQNTGGDFNKGRYLLAGLKKRETFRNRGSVYVITGRATQSAAMVNAIDFRKELSAILVGEPTGGRPNSYSENDEFRLPNSNIEVSYSTRYYRFQDTDTAAVMPDKLIEPSWESYPSGRDPVVEWILAQPLSK
jgi:C-terminal processing protease CtpA/Prc